MTAPTFADLGQPAVAEHPDGHRVVGTITGVGTRGVILWSPPLHAGFLSYADGWTVTVTAPGEVLPGGSTHPHSCRCDTCWSDALTEQESQR